MTTGSGMADPLIRDHLAAALHGAVNAVTGITIAALARTEHDIAPGGVLWLSGTSQIHAEAAALTAARQLDDGPVIDVWVTCSLPGHVTPCGGCRQLLLDYATWQGSPIEVVSVDSGDGSIRRYTLEELLPVPFISRNLTEGQWP